MANEAHTVPLWCNVGLFFFSSTFFTLEIITSEWQLAKKINRQYYSSLFGPEFFFCLFSAKPRSCCPEFGSFRCIGTEAVWRLFIILQSTDRDWAETHCNKLSDSWSSCCWYTCQWDGCGAISCRKCSDTENACSCFWLEKPHSRKSGSVNTCCWSW